MVHDDVPVGLDGVEVRFDDRRAVADAGIVVAATLAERLGIEALVDETVELGERAGAANAGAQGDDADLGDGAGRRLASMTAMCCARGAPARCSVTASRRPRPWAPSCARSPSGTCASSTACSTARLSEPGAPVRARATSGWSSTSTVSSARSTATPSRAPPTATQRQRGYHPILASRAGTGEVLHVRLRKGSANTSRGAQRFVDELIARVERAGASGPKLLRADSGFWNKTIFARLAKAGWELLDRGAPAAHGSRRDRADPRARLADPGRLPADQPGADRRDDAGRPAAGRPPRPHPRPPRPAAADLGALSVPHQPHRRARSRRGRTPPARRRRALASAISKTRRSRTSPPGASSPTPPGR